MILVAKNLVGPSFQEVNQMRTTTCAIKKCAIKIKANFAYFYSVKTICMSLFCEDKCYTHVVGTTARMFVGILEHIDQRLACLQPQVAQEVVVVVVVAGVESLGNLKDL